MATQENQIKTLEALIAAKDKLIEAQAKQIATLMARIETLERRLGLNSSNSSLPPSSDEFFKPAPKSLRVSSKSFGGQKGHQGGTLKQVGNPDTVIQLPIHKCITCKKDLSLQSSQPPIKRQVFEIEMKRQVVEYQAEHKLCTCGKHNIAEFPADVTAPVQYGSSAKAAAVYFMQQFIAKQRCCELFNDLFGIPISDTTLMAFEETCAKNVTSCYHDIRYALAKTAIKHLDESGLKVDKHMHWLHVLSNEQATYYHIDRKRSIVWQDLTGIIVHDHWSPYFKIEGVEHALCNAHHLRELQGIIDLYEEPWASKMRDLLNGALNGGEPTVVSQRYDEVIKEGIAYHESKLLINPKGRKNSKKRKGHNLLLRLQKFKTAVLRFIYDPKVPFTNNQAERDIRMVKTKQKVSGCFRSENGAEEFVKIRSIVSTLKKQKCHLFEELKLACTKVYQNDKFMLA